ncbi:MAG: peptide ABC transporter substrate-binding protein, partial [Cellulomonadaceae bacterium]|nr:peptide ABC transporter substrate-binding protein [Cellulomonadaceae bacterium]
MRNIVRTRYRSAALLVVVATALVGCSSDEGTSPTGAATEAAPQTQTLTLGNGGDIASWDPGEMKEGMVIHYAEAVYDPLLRKTADSDIEGNLATDFVYNDDLTELTLTLQSGIAFTDGEAFDADAVKANLEARKAGAGSASETAKSITAIEVVDPQTVKLTLAAPNPGLLAGLATYTGFMVSPASIAAGTAGTIPVGTGPYTLDDAATQKGTSYTFQARDDYWNRDAFPFGTIVIKPITDFTARYNALTTGQIQFMYATADMAGQAEAAGLTVDTVPGEWQGIILQDRAGTLTPALGDVRVRQAINYALDRETILATFYAGYGQVSTQTFNPASDAWVDSLNEKYPYDPEKAKSLLADAGYADGFTLPLSYSEGFQTPLIPILSQYLSEVGITLEPVSVASFSNGGLDTLVGQSSFVLSFSTNIPAWTDVLNKLTPTSLWNHFGYTDDTVAGFLRDIPLATGDEQKKLYQDFNTYIVDQAWFAPIATLDNIHLSSPDIKVTMQQAQLVP